MMVNILNGQSDELRCSAGKLAASRRNDGRRVKAALATLAIGLLAGCAAARPIKYYDLSVPGGLAPATAQTLPLKIIVALPSAPGLYRDTRVVYSTGDQQLGAYEYERWVGPPNELIRDVFLRNLRASGRYAGVYTSQASAAGDFTLTMRIYDFREQDSGGSLAGRLNMDVELKSDKTGDTVWQHYYSHDEPITAKTVPDVVAALNRNVQMAANEIGTGMDQYFAAHPPQ